MKEISNEKFKELQTWFSQRLNDAIKVAETSEIDDEDDADINLASSKP
jgi:hypothetical protein